MRLKKRINPEIERKLKDAIFVGRLASEADLAGTPLRESVYTKDGNYEQTQFHIKCLSPIPEEVLEQFYYPNRVITGSTYSNNNYRKLCEWIDYDKLYHFEIAQKVKGFLKDKLIAFTLSVTSESIYVELLKVEDTVPNGTYLKIPGPDLNLDENKTDFEQKLIGETKPFTLKYYPHIFDLPEFIYYENTLYEVALNPSLNATTYTQQESITVKYQPEFDETFIQYVDMRIDNHLFFIQADKVFDIRDSFISRGLTLNDDVEKAKNDRDTTNLNVVDEPYDDRADNNLMDIKYQYSQKEMEFLRNLTENAHRRGLYYEEEDLYTFHISLKTNLLSIIGGMSGTGKSQLAKLYGETLGLEYGKELLMIPVSPSYHEPNDVLGYLNPTTGVYYESETGLVNLLLEAEKNEEQMYMVIFDEMNLSQVEHWFSPFISLLEIEEENRYLPLFNENSFCVNDKYKSKIKIGNNVIFVGTVNFDETTKDFSDRLLDRTNIIIPTKRTFRESIDILRSQDSSSGELKVLDIQPLSYRKHWLATDNNKNYLSILTDEEVKILDELHQLIHKDNHQRGVSFRVALGISRFLANIPVNEDGHKIIKRSKAFDIQLAQRVLTKIKGLGSYVEPLVGKYENEEYVHGSISRLLSSKESDTISFSKSLSLLKSKAKELVLYGYAN